MGMLHFVTERTPQTQQRVRAAVIAGDLPRWLRNSKRRSYIAQVIISTPGWVDRRDLKLIQYNAQCISALTGIEHHVGHKIPLHHPLVSGLTVPWNLEIIPAKRNLADSNRWNNGRQLDLF